MINTLECKNLSITYGKKQILKDINFKISTNQIVSIVGSSGGGKSSLLKAVAGFIPFNGQILLNNRLITKSDGTRGIVFQDSSLFPWLNVKQNIAFGLKAKSIPENQINDRVDELLKDIDMLDYKDNKISSLSGGMKQRIAIARALANKPPFLLMDEPFSALDTITKEKMQNLILKIALCQNIGIILVTHDLNEAIKCGNYILVLDKDKKTFKEIDNPLFNRPTSTDYFEIFDRLKKSILKNFGSI